MHLKWDTRKAIGTFTWWVYEHIFNKPSDIVHNRIALCAVINIVSTADTYEMDYLLFYRTLWLWFGVSLILRQ